MSRDDKVAIVGIAFASIFCAWCIGAACSHYRLAGAPTKACVTCLPVIVDADAGQGGQ